MRSPFVGNLAVVFAVGCSSSLLAASPDVEIFGGVSFWLPRVDSLYDASYTPSRVIGIAQLFQEPDPRNRARQLLSVTGGTSYGLGIGTNVYFHRNLGFQLLFDRARVDVGGRNPPHVVDLTWDTIAFPAPDPVSREIRLSFDWPETRGSVETQTFGLNATLRFGVGRTVSGNVSGGLSYFRLHGELEPVGAHAAWLGGHAVLFSELYEMTSSIRPAGTVGFNVGGGVELSLGSRVALVADGRLLHGPKTEASVRLEGFLSPNVVTVPLERIESLLSLPPIEIDPSYFRVQFGVKWKL